MRNAMRSVADTAELIHQGRTLLLAGDESLLTQLPTGNWIAGTASAFITEHGGIIEKELLFVTDITELAAKCEVKRYQVSELRYIAQNYPASGFTVLIIPANSEIHASFAKDVQSYEGVFNAPLLGWVSGVDVTEIGRNSPKVFAGSPTPLQTEAVAMHVGLPAGKLAHLDIINLFSPSNRDIIVFEKEGFSCSGTCSINGKQMNFASFLKTQHIDTKLPLVANYNGALVNVSIQSIDEATGEVCFYAPVFPGVEYSIANPIDDYADRLEQYLEIEQCMQSAGACMTVYSCNCVLNFLYAQMQGKKHGTLTGPMTFGEIAYMLLNQTIVNLKVTDSA